MKIKTFEDFWHVQDFGDREQLEKCWKAAQDSIRNQNKGT